MISIYCDDDSCCVYSVLWALIVVAVLREVITKEAKDADISSNTRPRLTSQTWALSTVRMVPEP